MGEKMLNIIVYFSLFFAFSICAAKANLDIFKNGKISEVVLPFEYFSPPQNAEKILLMENEYIAIEIKPENSNVVLVLGPLKPCIAIVVASKDKVVAFHRTVNSRSDSLIETLEQEFAGVDKAELRARIHAPLDEVAWVKNGFDKRMKSTQKQMLPSLKDLLEQKFNIARKNIYATVYNLRDSKERPTYDINKLGCYYFAPLNVAISFSNLLENITPNNGDTVEHVKLFSTCLAAESVKDNANTGRSDKDLIELASGKVRTFFKEISIERTKRYQKYFNYPNSSDADIINILYSNAGYAEEFIDFQRFERDANEMNNL
jgi:hypothetical protein